MLLLNKFKEFLIEKIDIVETNFGDKYNFTNHNFSKGFDGIYTFFQHEGHEIVVEYTNHNSFNFAILDKKGEANYLHSQSNIKIKNIQEFYGKILYIFSEMVKKYNIDFFKIYSHPKEQKTSRLYANFVKNPHLKEIIKSLGFNHFSEKNEEEDGIKFKVYFFAKRY